MSVLPADHGLPLWAQIAGSDATYRFVGRRIWWRPWRRRVDVVRVKNGVFHRWTCTELDMGPLAGREEP